MPRCSCSVFDPVEAPHCWQRYSYRLPVGKTRSSRSRVGVATRQRGQYNRDAFRFRNCSSCSEGRGLPALGGPGGHPGLDGLRGGGGIRLDCRGAVSLGQWCCCAQGIGIPSTKYRSIRVHHFAETATASTDLFLPAQGHKCSGC